LKSQIATSKGAQEKEAFTEEGGATVIKLNVATKVKIINK